MGCGVSTSPGGEALRPESDETWATPSGSPLQPAAAQQPRNSPKEDDDSFFDSLEAELATPPVSQKTDDSYLDGLEAELAALKQDPNTADDAAAETLDPIAAAMPQRVLLPPIGRTDAPARSQKSTLPNQQPWPPSWSNIHFNSRWRGDLTSRKVSNLVQRFPQLCGTANGRYTVLRFLTGFDGDVEEAVQALQAHVEWMQLTLPTLHGQLLRALRTGLCYRRGNDLAGRPLVIWCADKYDKDVMTDKSCGMLLEYVVASALAGAQLCDGRITLMAFCPDDSYFSKSMFECMAAAMGRNFPDAIHEMLIWPMTGANKATWWVAKWWIDDKVREHIQLMPGAQPTKLQHFVAAKHLKEEWGGTDRWSFNENLDVGDNLFASK